MTYNFLQTTSEHGTSQGDSLVQTVNTGKGNIHQQTYLLKQLFINSWSIFLNSSWGIETLNPLVVFLSQQYARMEGYDYPT